jgi:hypothetical protein
MLELNNFKGTPKIDSLHSCSLLFFLREPSNTWWSWFLPMRAEQHTRWSRSGWAALQRLPPTKEVVTHALACPISCRHAGVHRAPGARRVHRTFSLAATWETCAGRKHRVGVHSYMPTNFFLTISYIFKVQQRFYNLVFEEDGNYNMVHRCDTLKFHH